MNRFVVRRGLAEPSEVEATMIRVPAPTVPPTSQDFMALPAPTIGSTAIGGKYELGGKIAQGTFGVVYTAKDLHLDRSVAIKLLNAAHLANKEIVQRFLQEARAAARVAHPGIVTMFDCGTMDNGAYIAMELLAGQSLTARLQRSGKLAPAVAVEIARQVASALDAAHKADVLHRDLKPDNIYIVPDPAMPSGERIKVLDFGLAKLGNNGQTQMNTVFGTPRYMSPEQCRSATQIDHRSDIYALGCILFELVAGRTPFEGTLRELVDRHQRAPIPRASSFSTEVSPVLDDLIMQMLQKDPALRPQTMAAVQRMLKSVDSLPAAAQTIALGTAPRPFSYEVMPAPAMDTIPRTPSASWSELRRAAIVTARPTRGAAIIAAAIAFVVAGALTAVMARGPARARAETPPTAQIRP